MRSGVEKYVGMSVPLCTRVGKKSGPALPMPMGAWMYGNMLAAILIDNLHVALSMQSN